MLHTCHKECLETKREKVIVNKKEEKTVKLDAKTLYNTLVSTKEELFVVDWYNDSQPKEKVKQEIISILDKCLPESYDRQIFTEKSTLIFEHILDKASTGFSWVA